MSYNAKKVAGQKIDAAPGVPDIILFRDISGKFATTTNGAIVKKSNGEILPDDEPLFLLRARDLLAVSILRFYKLMCENNPQLDWQVSKLEEAIWLFEKFKSEHPERMKQPGITRGR